MRYIHGRVDPARLIEKGAVSFRHVTEKDKPAAWVQRVSRNTWMVTLNDEVTGLIKSKRELELVEYALLLHEVAHIRYGTSFGRISGSGVQLYRWLYNLMEDCRIEYNMQMEFPSMIAPFRALYGAMKNVMYVSKNVPNNETAKLGALKADCDALYEALRFGKVDEGHDVTMFVLPRMEVVKRGGQGGARTLTTQTFAYLLAKHRIPVVAALKLLIKVVVVNADERSEDERDVFEKGMEFDTQDSLGGQGGEVGAKGSGSVTDLLDADRDPRWDRVVDENQEDIASLTQYLRRLLGRLMLRPARDGDLSMMPQDQQQAYIDSFEGGEASWPYFRRFIRHEPKIDVLLLLDQSGSMGNHMGPTSDAAIIVAAALERLQSCRLASAGFGGPENGTRLIKSFRSPSWSGDYTPVSDGGTPMGDCMKDVAVSPLYAWRPDAIKLFICVTDGGPDTWGTVAEAMQMRYYDGTLRVPVMFGHRRHGASKLEVPDSYASSYERAFRHPVLIIEAGSDVVDAVKRVVEEAVVK